MPAPRWNLDLVDVDTTGADYALGRLVPRGARLSFAATRSPVVTFVVDNHDLSSLDGPIVDWRSRVKCYRVPGWTRTPGAIEPTGVLRAYNVVGSCVDEGNADGSGSVQVPTVGPLALYLGRRERQADRTFAAVEQATIPEALIDDENARYPTRIRTGQYPTTTGVSRTALVPAGRGVLAAIDELAGAYGGYEYEGVPVDDVPGVMADWRLHYPMRGVENAEVYLEHGVGKRNIESFSREVQGERITSDLHVIGRVEGATQVRADRTNIATRQAYRALFDSTEAFGDVVDNGQVGLIADALAAYRSGPRELLKLKPAATFELEPFEDFGIGDRVSARIRSGRVDIDGSVRIWGFDIEVGDDGDERLVELSIEPDAGA